MEKRDLRLYYYDSGNLKKAPGNLKFEDREAAIAQMNVWKLKNEYFARCQFLLVEYTGLYKSKMLEIL